MASRDRDRIAAPAAGRGRCRALACPACPSAQVAGQQAMLAVRLGAWAGGPDRGGERVPAVAAEGQRRTLRGLAVADLDGAGARLPCLDAVASVGVGVAALGPVRGKGHQDLSSYRSLIASAVRDRDSAGFSDVVFNGSKIT